MSLLLLSSPSRFTWGVIQARRAKSGTAVLLTSHSMEEADLLADGIAIMSHGRWGGTAGGSCTKCRVLGVAAVAEFSVGLSVSACG